MKKVNKTISIQGYQGSFHHEATIKFFGKNINIKSCKNFKDIINDLKNNISDYGVMAIENSTVGSIIANYTLIQDPDINIVGEVYLPIRHNLIGIKGSKLSDIKEVRSHYMAIMQCKNFLDNNNLKSIDWEDTSKAVIDVKTDNLISIAAIGSSVAAKIFDLEIINKNIHDAKQNWTRFLILQNIKTQNNLESKKDNKQISKTQIDNKKSEYYKIIDNKIGDKNFINNNPFIKDQKDYNKATITFTIKDESGSLCQVLNLIKKYNINMSKIQSFSLPNTKFEYGFYIDLEFADIKKFNSCIKSLEKVVNKMRLHGVYKNGK